MGNSISKKDKYFQTIKKYIPNIDKQNPIIKYQIDELIRWIYDISYYLIPLKSIFQINNCKNNFIECFKEIYTLRIKDNAR